MENIKQSVKAIIFDMDGTIIDTESVWSMVTIEILKQHGVIIGTSDQQHRPFFKTLSGMGLENAVAAMKKYFDLKETVDVLVHKQRALASTLFQSKVNFIDGFEDFHKKIQQHEISTSIATNACAANLKVIKDVMKLEQFFGDNIYCVADVDNKAKPDPALFLHAAAKLGVKPEECIVFEDSFYGFMAAKAAGMRCVAIKNEVNHGLLHHVHGSIISYHHAEDELKRIITI